MHKIIHLPNGYWCLEINGERSSKAPYDSPIQFQGFIAWTDYFSTFGGEMVCPIQGSVPHEAVDKSL